MLCRFDDYPIHQTPEPLLSPATSDRNVYDRYWFNGYARDGSFYFAIGAAFYRHRRIFDCAFSFTDGERQWSFFGSRRAPEDPEELDVGPFRLRVIEPMRRARLELDDNSSGLSGVLDFVAHSAAVEEGRQTHRLDGRTVMDATRFAQFGRWRGELQTPVGRLAIDPAFVHATKDRSWGLRGVGEPDVGGAPALSVPQFFFLWAPLFWPDSCSHFGLFEDAAGNRWQQGGATLPLYTDPHAVPVNDPDERHFPLLHYEIDYQPGSRWAAQARVGLESHVDRIDIELQPILRFQMKGLGYQHPVWRQGNWHAEEALGADEVVLDEIDPLAPENVHVQQVVRAQRDDTEGIGVLEQVCLGPHRPSGFSSFLDGA